MSDLTGLGWRGQKDERDKNFLLKRLPEAADLTHRYWTVQPALDQGSTPQCVGYGGFRWLTSYPIHNTPPFTPTDLYREAQKADEYPGENYDGTSVHGLFKVLKTRGYVGEYRWAFDIETIIDHLLVKGPVCIGTVWTMGMFAPDQEGYVDDIGGEIAGGHCYLLIGANRIKRSSHGVGAVRFLNSWGVKWADHGRAWMSFAKLNWLLKQDAEAAAANEILHNINQGVV